MYTVTLNCILIFISQDPKISFLENQPQQIQMMKYDNDTTCCSIFFNTIYHAYKANIHRDYMDNWNAITDNIKIKTRAVLAPLANDFHTKVGQQVEEQTTLLSKTREMIFFKKNDDDKKEMYED